MGLRVLLLTRYGRTGASSRLRFLQYLPGLDEYDIDVHPALPWVPSWVARTVLGSLPLVIDFDDAWHLRYNRSPNPLVRWTLGKKLEQMARRADFVIVANKFLQSWAEDAGAECVTCIPTVVDLRRYPQTALPPGQALYHRMDRNTRDRALSRHDQERAEASPRRGGHPASARGSGPVLPAA